MYTCDKVWSQLKWIKLINNVKVINIIFNDFCIIATIKKHLLRVVFWQPNAINIAWRKFDFSSLKISYCLAVLASVTSVAVHVHVLSMQIILLLQVVTVA